MMPLNIPTEIDKYFYNRKNDIKLISMYINALKDNLSSQLLITGPLGVGKTFLLKKILKDQKDDIITIYIDINQIYGENKGYIDESIVLKKLMNELLQFINNEDKLFKKIIKLYSQLEIKDISLYDSKSVSKIPIPKIKDNYQKLSRFVMELPQKLVDNSDNINGIIIVFDEFQQLKKVEKPDAFFWLFRSYIQKQSNVCYIFTGSVSKTADVIQMINGPNGAFGGRMIQIDIDAFTKEETLNYINEKSDNIKFTDDGFERFYKCTKGIPAYINPFCNVLSPNVIYDENMIGETFKMKMDQIMIMCLYIWGTLEPIEKDIVKLFTAKDNLILKEIVEKIDNSKVTVIKYIDSLSMKGLLKYTSEGYMLTDSMLKTWLIYKKEINGYYPF